MGKWGKVRVDAVNSKNIKHLKILYDRKEWSRRGTYEFKVPLSSTNW